MDAIEPTAGEAEASRDSTVSLSHALLDKILGILGKDPSTWSHSDDLFLLSVCTTKVKREITRLVQVGQVRDKHLLGPLSLAGMEMAVLRVRLAAGIDWETILAPIGGVTTEVAVGLGKVSGKWKRRSQRGIK